MTFFQLRGHSRLALGAALLALMTFAPVASAQDEPAFVFPCADGVEWTAEAGQPITFFCGWGTQGGPGLLLTYVMAHQGTLIVEDGTGHPVLSIGPDEFATLWGDPEQARQASTTSPAPVRRAGALAGPIFWRRSAGRHLLRDPRGVPAPPGHRRVHTCWSDDGTRLASPPDHLISGPFEAVGTIIVED